MGQIEPTTNNLPLTEKHFSPDELAESLGLSSDTIVRLFEKEPGVLVIETNRGGGVRGRRYRTIRIPESVAARVYRRLANPESNGRRR
jgi:hypothetical protein